MVIPDGHDENHTLLERSTHGSKTALSRKLVGVTESSLLGGAERVGDGVAGDAGDGGLRVRNDDTVLNIESLDLGKGAGGGAVGGDELGDDSEDLGGVNSETSTVEVSVAHSVGVEIASISVAQGGVTSTDAAVSAGASGLRGDGTWVTTQAVSDC